MLLQAGAQAAPFNELIYVWIKSTAAGKSIIILLGVLSIFVWSVMLQKAFQTRQARKLNKLFVDEFHEDWSVNQSSSVSSRMGMKNPRRTVMCRIAFGGNGEVESRVVVAVRHHRDLYRHLLRLRAS